MKEFIICSAIRIDSTGKIYYGHRHNHCRDAASDELSWNMSRKEISKVEKTEGFITNQNRFVDRKEGLIIALDNNQVLDKNEIRGNGLHSEDLY
jgi:hypothetical protein